MVLAFCMYSTGLAFVGVVRKSQLSMPTTLLIIRQKSGLLYVARQFFLLLSVVLSQRLIFAVFVWKTAWRDRRLKTSSQCLCECD